MINASKREIFVAHEIQLLKIVVDCGGWVVVRKSTVCRILGSYPRLLYIYLIIFDSGGSEEPLFVENRYFLGVYFWREENFRKIPNAYYVWLLIQCVYPYSQMVYCLLTNGLLLFVCFVLCCLRKKWSWQLWKKKLNLIYSMHRFYGITYVLSNYWGLIVCHLTLVGAGNSVTDRLMSDWIKYLYPIFFVLFYSGRPLPRLFYI